MGLQFIETRPAPLFLMAIFNLVGMMNKRRNILTDVFAPYFADPLDRENWQKIAAALEPCIVSDMIPTGATPSKPELQPDGTITPMRVLKLPAHIASAFSRGEASGVIQAVDELRYSFDDDEDPEQNANAYMRWDAILTAYLTLRIMDDVALVLIESIKPFYKSISPLNLSPAQLWFFADEFMHGSLFMDDGLVFVPWGVIDQFRSGDPEVPGVVDVVMEKQASDLWFIEIPTITVGSESASVGVTGQGAAVLAPSAGLPFAVETTFTPSAEESCLATHDYYNASVLRYTVTPREGSGTLGVSYKTLIVE